MCIRDSPWGCTDYLNQKKKILNTGADVYELMNEVPVHTKAVLLDDRLSVVGSYNLDMRSTYLDTELMLVIDSKELNQQIQSTEGTYIEKSKEAVSYTHLLKEIFTSKSLQMASFTITEKGYALHKADGTWLPFVQADIQNGRIRPQVPWQFWWQCSTRDIKQANIRSLLYPWTCLLYTSILIPASENAQKQIDKIV